MNNYPTVRLGDVCEIVMGTSPEGNTISQNASDGIEFHQGKTCFGDLYLNESGMFTNAPVRFADAGNVIMSVRAPVGDSNITPRKIAIGRGLCTFNTKSNFEKLFLYYYLNSQIDFLKSKSTGSTFKAVNKDVISDLKIPLPPLSEQKHIAAVLDKCTELIAKYKQMLEKYDTLIKSRFIEMFGDPVLNPRKWNMEKLKTLTSKIGSGATPKGGRESYISEGISLVRSMNVYKGYFEYDGLAHITEEQARELDNVTLQENDVLINITGASVARCCILPKAVLPARVNQHVSILRTTDKLNPVYLSNLLITDTEQRVLLGIGGAGGATREAITKTELETLDIPVPPMSLQNDFAAFAHQIDKSKFAVQKSLEKAEILYKSLMQEYFG